MDSGFTNNIENMTMNLKKWNAMTKADQEIFTAAVQEIKPWIFYVTLKYCENIKKAMVSKGAKIYQLTPEEKSRYLKDAYSLYPEVRKVSGEIGGQFMDILSDFRER